MKKKLLMCLVCAGFATVATAMPAFEFVPVTGDKPVELEVGETIWIDVMGSNPRSEEGFQGLELYAGVTGPFRMTSILVDQPGSGTVFEGNSTGAIQDLYDEGMGAIGMTTTASGYVPAGIVAKIELTALQADIGATGTLETSYWGIPSNFADGPAEQDILDLVIVPEPMTALLLLAGVPFLRRRRP